VRYFVADQATFVLPTLGLLALWAGLGVAASSLSVRRLAVCVVAGAVCATAGPASICRAARRSGFEVRRARTLPFRDEACYWLVPWKQGEDSAERFVAAVGRQLGRGDVLLADATAAGPLLAARAAGLLPDAWELVTPWTGLSDSEWVSQVRAHAGRVYVVSPVPGYTPQAILDAGVAFERDGVLHRIAERQGGGR